MRVRSAIGAAVAAAVLVIAGGCAADDSGGAVSAGPTTLAAPVDVALVVEVTNASGGNRSGSITCQGGSASGTGTFLDAAASTAACGAIVASPPLLRRLTDGPATGVACTQQDGGPAEAHVTGSVHGKVVDTRFTRHGGCEIDDWNQLQALLGAP